MKTPKDILLNKWNNKTIGHFYILRAPNTSRSPREFLNQWMSVLLKEILGLKKETDITQIAHPDLLIVEKSTENKKGQYSWSKEHSDFKSFLPFMDYKRSTLDRKIVVITDGHLLTENICNKILKSLEEAFETTIFLLMPNPKALLGTIESRAITLNLRSLENSNQPPFFEHLEGIKEWLEKDIAQRSIEELKKASLIEFTQSLFKFLKGERREASILTFIKEHPEAEAEFLDILLDFERFRERDHEKKEGILKMLKWFSESKSYNNPQNERYYQLLKALQ